MTKIVTGYKATDLEMKCRGYQYELGVWHEFDGIIYLGSRGFHFSKYIPDVYAYSYKPGKSRLFKVEAKGVIQDHVAGTSSLCVAKHIRLVEEIKCPTDNNGNFGDKNMGESNEGYKNTGFANLGKRNIGMYNTGTGNIGSGNNGCFCVGWNNSGSDCHGCGNTGSNCSGFGNVGKTVAGFFCSGGVSLWFDLPYELEVQVSQSLLESLATYLSRDEPFEYTGWNLPNCTPERLEALHKKHVEYRKLLAGCAKSQEENKS